VRPILKAGSKRLFDQQAAKAGTVDEELARDRLAAFQGDRLNEAIAGPLGVVDDLALDASHTPAFRVSPQVGRIESSIEMIGVADLGQGRIHRLGLGRHELVVQGGLGADAIGVHRRRASELTRLQPILVWIEPADVLADRAEGVNIAIPRRAPVAKLNAELEGALGGLQEVVLVNADQTVEHLNVRDGRFADPDGGDLV